MRSFRLFWGSAPRFFGISSEPANEAHAPIRELLSNIRTHIKHISDKLSEVSSLLRQHACAESTLLGEMRISAIYAEVGMAFADLPSLEELSQFPKTSNDSTFFEALAEQTKLAGIKTQKLLFCMQNLKKEKLSDKIELLRTNYEANYLGILHAERELGKIHDNELRDKLQDLKFFEILQAEKANAHFLDICSKKGLLHRKIFYCHLLNLEIILLICILHCLGLTRMCKVRLKIFWDRKQANTPWSVVVF